MSTRPERLPGSRHKEIFPPGFDKKFDKYTSISRSGSHFSSKPEQLYYSLVERYDPETPIESIIVKSAWYGKQTRSAQHEFIVFQVEDIDVEGLINYLVLDRDAGDVHQGSSRTIAPASSSQATKANDTFRISYDGDIKRLLEECQLTPYKFLEELKFDTETPLRLYELVTLADVVSNRYPYYHALDSSCYLFAGVIWECIRLMRPLAVYNDALAYKRGKCNWFRYIPSSSAKQETYQELQARLPTIECDLWERRNACGWPMAKIDEAYGLEDRDYVHVACPPAELLPSTVSNTRSMSMRLHPIQSLNRMILPGLRSQSPNWMKYLVPE